MRVFMDAVRMTWVCPVLASAKTVSLGSHSVPEQEVDVELLEVIINLMISRTFSINLDKTYLLLNV
jgi:hypothetical protein